MLAEHYPIYRQQRFRSFHDALTALDRMLARDYAAEEITRTDFEGFLKATEAEQSISAADAHTICFYDSEFGMYNYGEQQGDVVSIGAVILTEPEHAAFSELIRNEEDAQMAERFQSFTGIAPQDLHKARPFPAVYADFKAFVLEHNVGTIYCLGSNDQERFGFMLQKYGLDQPEDRSILMRFRNFQKWLRDYDSRLAMFSLESLCELCGIDADRLHDAFSDALSLAGVWQHLHNEGVSEQEIAAEQAAIRARSQYRKSRRITFEQLPVASEALLARDVLIQAMQAANQKKRAVSPQVLKAICDDLKALLKEETEQ